MNKNLYHPYINDQGKLVSGSASLNHYIFTVKGGVQQYNDEIGIEYIKAFVAEHSDSINAEITKKATRNRFKVVS